LSSGQAADVSPGSHTPSQLQPVGHALPSPLPLPSPAPRQDWHVAASSGGVHVFASKQPKHASTVF
jgi:hypothetical protein